MTLEDAAFPFLGTEAVNWSAEALDDAHKVRRWLLSMWRLGPGPLPFITREGRTAFDNLALSLCPPGRLSLCSSLSAVRQTHLKTE